jgi:hypothetical protein
MHFGSRSVDSWGFFWVHSDIFEKLNSLFNNENWEWNLGRVEVETNGFPRVVLVYPKKQLIKISAMNHPNPSKKNPQS